MATKPFSERVARYTEDPTSDAAGVFQAVTAHLVAEEEASLGHQFAVARETAGLTQAQVATSAGMSQAEISKFEAGASNPTRTTLGRLGEALGMRLGWTPIKR